MEGSSLGSGRGCEVYWSSTGEGRSLCRGWWQGVCGPVIELEDVGRSKDDKGTYGKLAAECNVLVASGYA